MKRKHMAGGGDVPSPGQTVSNGDWDPNAAAAQLPKPATAPSSPGQAAVNDYRAKLKAAGGCSGVDSAMMAHADRVHPVGRR